MHKPLKILSILILLLTVSCGHRNEALRLLEKAQSLIESAPDSALMYLDSIFLPEKFLRKENYMEYLVMNVQAKYKSYKDIKDDTLIFEAKDYFIGKAHDPKLIAQSYLYSVMMLTTSCKKEEKTNSDESTSEKAIAVYDNKTGVMTYNFDAETLTIKINEQFATRSEQPSNRYIIESSELINKNVNNVFTTLKVTYIDTEEETSTTAWLIDNFIKTEIRENKTYYYIDNEVQSNNYSFCYNVGRDVYIVDVVNGLSSSREWDGLSKLPARWFVECTGHNCNASTCQPEKFEGYYGCTPCSVVDKDHWCEQTTTSGEGLGSIIGGILSGIGNIVK